MLRDAVSQTRYCCSLQFTIFSPKHFGLATLLLPRWPKNRFEQK